MARQAGRTTVRGSKFEVFGTSNAELLRQSRPLEPRTQNFLAPSRLPWQPIPSNEGSLLLWGLADLLGYCI